jgi:flagellar biosynthesis protein FliQ
MLLQVESLDLTITELAYDMIMTVLLVAGPVLLVGLVVGIGVSLFQALTSVQEQTLSLVPKMLAVLLVCLLLLAPALRIMVEYTHDVFSRLVSFGTS